MSAPFDPYYQWLSIPPDEQPANFYRLLGVKVFESNLEVIASAADRRWCGIKWTRLLPNVFLKRRYVCVKPGALRN